MLNLLPGQAGGGTTRLQNINAFDEAVVEGGQWIFEGEAFITTMDIEDGHVAVEGRLVGDSVSLHQGVLSGSGVIDSDVHNTGGTVSPGSSFGVLTIGQTAPAEYVQGADGELVIQIRPAADPQPGVDYDQLRVTGTAVFEDGTTVRIVPQRGVYRGGVNYIDGDVQFDPGKVNLRRCSRPSTACRARCTRRCRLWRPGGWRVW